MPLSYFLPGEVPRDRVGHHLRVRGSDLCVCSSAICHQQLFPPPSGLGHQILRIPQLCVCSSAHHSTLHFAASSRSRQRNRFGCCFAVQASRFRSRSSYRTSCSRDSGTSNSSGSCDEARDLEWAVVASICWLSYMVNHGPYLVLTTLGMAVPTFWSPWLDNSVVWLRLVQGLMVPCVLLLADMPHRSALRNMLRQSGRIYRHLSGNMISFGEFQYIFSKQKKYLLNK
ncbi:uncharacterized protein TNIN_314721 [Trichonephila inaurata madagascariensis]|uniref:Uncharacterized protein n=1 Tax=Trichonephila inaurata madagascariensis TaxID=2747483 RepID=A0A8X7CEC2_9ARAC|nr:uncharacterized protein TNIN_314721 [Trichonephila inaurata madagascariensis]